MANIDLEVGIGAAIMSSTTAPTKAMSSREVVAQRLRSLTQLAMTVVPHVLRMTPEEFGMILAGLQASAVTARSIYQFMIGKVAIARPITIPRPAF